MMKKLVLLLALLTTTWAGAQELPYFAYNSFDGWIYNNPGIALTESNISNARIRLYVDSQGLVLTLTSPEFACQGLDSIRADVKWRSASQSVALTMALDDAQGMPLDSASCLPTSSSRDQDFVFVVPVPTGMTTAQLRFVSWDAEASTSGAVRRIILTGIAAASPSVPLGDVDGNGTVNIGDVTSLISIVLSGRTDVNMEAADIDRNGSIDISDVTRLISMILSGNLGIRL